MPASSTALATSSRDSGAFAFQPGGRLHSIELCNYKSYGGKRVIGPFKQFTSIIGPNGAGKSNVMDAIAFVAGLTSRDLRGKQLKDLIYRASSDTGDGARSSPALSAAWKRRAWPCIPTRAAARRSALATRAGS